MWWGQATNANYGGATPNVTNVFFSDFSDDPWQQASVMGAAPTPASVYQLVVCDGCGHCDDLGLPRATDPVPLTNERARFETFYNAWMADA